MKGEYTLFWNNTVYSQFLEITAEDLIPNFIIGCHKDKDYLLRAAGFEANTRIGTLRIEKGGELLDILDIFTLGEQKIYGLIGTDDEHRLVSDDFDYLLNHYHELNNSGQVIESAWLTIGRLDTEKDYDMQDELVYGSIEDILRYSFNAIDFIESEAKEAA